MSATFQYAVDGLSDSAGVAGVDASPRGEATKEGNT